MSEIVVEYDFQFGEWIATDPRYPSLSWIEKSAEQARQGLQRLLDLVEAEPDRPGPKRRRESG